MAHFVSIKRKKFLSVYQSYPLKKSTTLWGTKFLSLEVFRVIPSVNFMEKLMHNNEIWGLLLLKQKFSYIACFPCSSSSVIFYSLETLLISGCLFLSQFWHTLLTSLHLSVLLLPFSWGYGNLLITTCNCYSIKLSSVNKGWAPIELEFCDRHNGGSTKKKNHREILREFVRF